MECLSFLVIIACSRPFSVRKLRAALSIFADVLLCDDDHACVFFLLPDAKERLAKRFSADGVFNYTSLLLSQEDDMLYVGAREELFALSLSDISKTKLQKNVRPIPREMCNRCPFFLVYFLNHTPAAD